MTYASADPIAAGGADETMSNASIDGTFLFESIVSDLHWTAVHAGTFACLIGACTTETVGRRLQPWQHLFQDNSQIAILGLRYHDEMGVPAAIAGKIASFYVGVANVKSKSMQLARVRLQASSTPIAGVMQVSGEWRAICQVAIQVLLDLEPLVKLRLSPLHAQNAQIIVGFLREAAAGDTRRVNEWGEVVLPTLVQRRRDPRLQLSTTCRIRTDQRVVDGVINNVSRQGLGIVCDHAFTVGQVVSVELDGGKSIKAKVAWTKGDQAGLALSQPLSLTDPLFGRRR